MSNKITAMPGLPEKSAHQLSYTAGILQRFGILSKGPIIRS